MQEADRLSKLFDDAEFRRLFTEFAQETADPRARAEREAYIRQLEAEGRAEEAYGRGTQLVLPQPAFVIKTRCADAGASTSSGGGADKVFINVCTSGKLQPPAMRACERDGRRGSALQIPGCLARKPVATTDRAGAPAVAWVFVVHPEAVRWAAEAPAVHDALVGAVSERRGAGPCAPHASSQHLAIHRLFSST